MGLMGRMSRIAILATISAVGCVSPETQPAEPVEATGTAADPTSIRPFEVAVPDVVLAALDERLARTRFPDQVGTNWAYGADLDYMRALVTYWRDEYDWRERERQLNAFDHYKTQIDGLDVHFIHQQSPQLDALPLLVLHGWPGSIVEFMEIIGPLSDPGAHGGQAEDAFHVVAASLPGYGFSDRPHEPGMGPEQIADLMAQLMARLGYDQYALQGGDWGAVITRWMAYTYPERSVGLHINLVVAPPPPGVENPMALLTPEEIQKLRADQALERGAPGDFNAYQAIQGTKPQTLGYGLNDSPVGLAAWIIEKFHAWCDCQGDLESIFTKDQLLDNVMLYWVTETPTSAARLYYEARQQSGQVITMPPGRVEVPTAASIFPYELTKPPRPWAEAYFNITRWTEFPRGGHFGAFEQPELMVDDVRAFYRDLR